MILKNLSSQSGQRSEQGNRRVAASILKDPANLSEIKLGLEQKNTKLLGDCAEVCSMVAEQDPELIVPFAALFVTLLNHKNTRVRWESMHALALVSPFVPDLIAENLSLFENLFRNDKSIIVRDYAIKAAGNFASTGSEQARKAFPLINLAFTLHATKHAKHGLDGLAISATHLRDKKSELEEIAELFMQHPRPSIRESARRLRKILEALI